jgi:integrase
MKGSVYKTEFGYQVRFGRKICRRFKSLQSAERFLTGLRYETDRGTFDLRDYRSNMPLGVSGLVDQYLKLKRQQLKPSSFRSLANYLRRASDAWGHANIKHINYGHIEDFLYGQQCSDKTRANIKSCLHAFFEWASRREQVPMPEFPRVNFELGFRNIIAIDTQQLILEEIRRLTWDTDPKIWWAFHCLTTYISIRPGELLKLRERQLDLNLKAIVIPSPKEKRPKITYLLDEDVEFLKALPRGLPDLPFFRHRKGGRGRVVGKRWGKNYLAKLWKKACDNLGIEGVDMYGGTRHSTATALGKVCTPEEVRDVTGHTSKAFERYFQNTQGRALRVTQRVKKLTDQHVINILGGDEKGKLLKFKE